MAGTSIMGPPVPVPPSNNPGTSADGLPGVVETPPSPTDLVKGVHGHYIDGRAPTITWPNDVLTVLLKRNIGRCYSELKPNVPLRNCIGSLHSQDLCK